MLESGRLQGPRSRTQPIYESKRIKGHERKNYIKAYVLIEDTITSLLKAQDPIGTKLGERPFSFDSSDSYSCPHSFGPLKSVTPILLLICSPSIHPISEQVIMGCLA